MFYSYDDEKHTLSSVGYVECVSSPRALEGAELVTFGEAE